MAMQERQPAEDVRDLCFKTQLHLCCETNSMPECRPVATEAAKRVTVGSQFLTIPNYATPAVTKFTTSANSQ